MSLSSLFVFSRRRCQLGVLAVMIALSPSAPDSVAQDSDGPRRITLVHRAPLPSTIPPLGSLMQIKVETLNTVDITTTIRLVGAKDGRFIDIAFPKGKLNSADHPMYSIDVPAPIAAMTYQFILHQPDGSITTSEKFIVKRPCIPHFKIAEPDKVSTAAYNKEIATLVAKSKELELETLSLESSLKLVEEMKIALSTKEQQ
ncbi:MAG: hypothetical protein RL326_210 [Pseudomonadota bacterium]